MDNRDMEKRTAGQEVERASSGPVYLPDVDIYETDQQTVVVADMPGADEKGISVTLEQDVLTIEGRVTVKAPEGARLSHAEYGVGDFRRAFTLTDNVDREKISASIRNGVLKVVLPKPEAVKARTIPITAG